MSCNARGSIPLCSLRMPLEPAAVPIEYVCLIKIMYKHNNLSNRINYNYVKICFEYLSASLITQKHSDKKYLVA